MPLEPTGSKQPNYNPGKASQQHRITAPNKRISAPSSSIGSSLSPHVQAGVQKFIQSPAKAFNQVGQFAGRVGQSVGPAMEAATSAHDYFSSPKVPFMTGPNNMPAHFNYQAGQRAMAAKNKIDQIWNRGNTAPPPGSGPSPSGLLSHFGPMWQNIQSQMSNPGTFTGLAMSPLFKPIVNPLLQMGGFPALMGMYGLFNKETGRDLRKLMNV